MATLEFDCVRCGACCCNTERNRAIDYVDYVEVEARDRLRKRGDLMRKLVVYNEDREAHMKLDREQRCVALSGTVGEKVACKIYEWRPSGCRRVEAGSRECRRARRERGIDPPLRIRRAANRRA